jgi:hypothetical protein
VVSLLVIEMEQVRKITRLLSEKETQFNRPPKPEGPRGWAGSHQFAQFLGELPEPRT